MKRLFIIWGMVLSVGLIMPSGAWGEDKPAGEATASSSQAKEDNSKSGKTKAEKPAKEERADRSAQGFPASSRSEDKKAAVNYAAGAAQQKADKSKPSKVELEKPVAQTEGPKAKSTFSWLSPQNQKGKNASAQQSPSGAGGWSTPAETKRLVTPNSKGFGQAGSVLPAKSDGEVTPVFNRTSSTGAEAKTRSSATTSGRKNVTDNASQDRKDKVYAPEDAWLFPQKPENQRTSVPNLNTEKFRAKVQQGNTRASWERTEDHPIIINRPGGEKVTADYFDRHNSPVLGGHYETINRRFGEPVHKYCYLPRSADTYAKAYRKGYREGFHDGAHYVPSPYEYGGLVYTSFYFGFYFDDPNHLDFWYAGYHPSVYHYYGWVPRWCQSPSIVVYNLDPYPYSWQRPVYAYYYATPDRALDWAGAQGALLALGRAWEQSDVDFLAGYLGEGENINIYFGNEYSYSLPAEDYYTMTLDAMATVKTLSLEFDNPIWLNVNEFFVTGRHIFVSPDNARQTVYISYRLHRYADNWYIIAAGSSPQPIEHNYKDFRDQ